MFNWNDFIYTLCCFVIPIIFCVGVLVYLAISMHKMEKEMGGIPPELPPQE